MCGAGGVVYRFVQMVGVRSYLDNMIFLAALRLVFGGRVVCVLFVTYLDPGEPGFGGRDWLWAVWCVVPIPLSVSERSPHLTSPLFPHPPLSALPSPSPPSASHNASPASPHLTSPYAASPPPFLLIPRPLLPRSLIAARRKTPIPSNPRRRRRCCCCC